MIYKVYKHIFPNKKVYIGLTYRSVTQRWQNGSGYCNQPLIYRAIRKYGWDNIKHEIIATGLTKEEAEKLEIELISKYKSNNPKYGYNVDNGGNSANKISDTTRLKMSQSRKGKEPWNKGKTGFKLSEEHKEKISLTLRGRICSDETKEKIRHSNLGKIVSEETRKKLSESHKGKNVGNINYFAKHKFIGKNNPKARSVNQYNLDGTFIKTWESIADAVRTLDLRGTSLISQCCSKTKRTAYSFIWEYSNN